MNSIIKTLFMALILSTVAVTFANADPLNDFVHSNTADKHEAAGLGCDSCHGEGQPSADNAPTMETCIGCHENYDVLKDAEKVQKYNYNPHNGHFVDLECSSCHHGHSNNEQFCSSCHEVSIKQ